MRCIAPGIQQMPAHHTHSHHHHQTQLYNIDPNAGDLIPPQTSPTQAPAAPPRGARAQGRAGADDRCPGGGGTGRGAGAASTGAAGGAGAGGRGGLVLGPGLGRGPGPPGERGPPPGGGGVWVAELGLLRDHQGDGEPALRCRAPPEGRGEPGGAPGGWATLEDH